MIEKMLCYHGFRPDRLDVSDLHLRDELDGIFSICLDDGDVRSVGDRSVPSKEDEIVWHLCIRETEIGGG